VKTWFQAFAFKFNLYRYTEAMAADHRVAEMLRLNDDRNKAVSDMARLAYLLTHLKDEGGGRGGRGGGGGKGRKMFRVRQALEASFVDEAEIVFTTLTSSSRRVFRQLTHGFDTVLVDEAAQANEVATLIPFLHGARRCVLVGDPQQLPSTVLSGAAQGVSFQRSLFERFTMLGAQALLLSVQYRMHPAIRAFPSDVFYEGRLVDSESVRSAQPEPYHAVGLHKLSSADPQLEGAWFQPFLESMK
jgi:senataxin